MTDFNDADSCVHCGEEPAVHGDACQICWAFLGNVKDPCVHCGHPTGPGSGRWVNRVGGDNTRELLDGRELYLDGWACVECLSDPCDACGEDCFDYENTWCGARLCPDCLPDPDAFGDDERDPQLVRIKWKKGDERGTWWFRVPEDMPAKQVLPTLERAGKAYLKRSLRDRPETPSWDWWLNGAWSCRNESAFCETAEAGIYWLNDDYDEARPKTTVKLDLEAAL